MPPPPDRKIEIAIAFGKALRVARVKAGASQEGLALDCDLDRTYISQLERGLRQPTLTTIVVIAERLGLAPDALVKRAILALQD